MQVILASRSPRRREILTFLGVPFEIVSADADESSSLTDPVALVRELALRKGRATRELLRREGRWSEDMLIIAADTVVAAGDRILGKPQDDADAAEMLRLLSGSAHRVISGIALLCDDREAVDSDETAVHFGTMSEKDIKRYVKSGEPQDKAGGYAIQGLASLWIKGLEGDYFNVVGLPVYRLNQLVTSFVDSSLADLADG